MIRDFYSFFLNSLFALFCPIEYNSKLIFFSQLICGLAERQFIITFLLFTMVFDSILATPFHHTEMRDSMQWNWKWGFAVHMKFTHCATMCGKLRSDEAAVASCLCHSDDRTEEEKKMKEKQMNGGGAGAEEKTRWNYDRRVQCAPDSTGTTHRTHSLAKIIIIIILCFAHIFVFSFWLLSFWYMNSFLLLLLLSVRIGSLNECK